MPKPRKMLSDWEAPYIQSLMRLIETQSKPVLANWAVDYSEKVFLPLWIKHYPDDRRPQIALYAAREWLSGSMKLPQAKTAILGCHAAAREAEGNPIAQAAARAVGQSASTIHSATHCLGLAFYGALAVAYDTLGTDASWERLEQCAAVECGRMYDALLAVSVDKEPNQVYMKKSDYKKDFKNLYLPGTTPSIIEVPPIRFAMLEGEGDPNGETFADATSALYSFSYTVRMSYKSSDVPQGYYDYTVFPLEGVWDLVDKTKPSTDKSNYAYEIMIRQPDFLTDDLFNRFISETRKKKANPDIDKIKLATIFEGLCCQMLHIGSYDNEPESFEKMERFCRDNGFERASRRHREIYLSDPRKVDADKLKTVLRFKIVKNRSEKEVKE